MKTEFYPIKYYDASEWESAGTGALSGAATGAALGPWGAAVGGLVGGAVGLFTGLSQKKKAENLAKHNPYPIQQVPDAIQYNQQLAKQMANEGLPSQQFALAQKNIQRGQNAALRSATERRAGLGLISPIQQSTNDSMAQLDAQNANARLANQRTLLGVNNTVGNYQQQAFDWNMKNRYNQNYLYSQQLLGAGNANIVGGIDKAVSGFLPYIGNGNGGGKGLFGWGRKNSSGLSDPNIGGGI